MRGAVILAALAVVAFGAAKRLEAGERAPEVALKGLDGDEIRYSPPGDPEATTAVTVVAFIDPDQEASRRALSDLASIRTDLGDAAEPARWLMIASGKLAESELSALRAAAKAHAHMEVALDPDRSVYAGFGVVALPTTFVVGTDGIVVVALPGRSAAFHRDLDTGLRKALGLAPREAPLDETEEQTRARRLRSAARELAGRRRHEQAASRLREAAELCPDDAELWSELGDEYLELRMGDEALAAFDRALGLAATSRSAAVGRACALAYVGDAEAAEKAIREALRKPPQDPRLYYSLGLVLERRGDAAGAARAYREAYERLRDAR